MATIVFKRRNNARYYQRQSWTHRQWQPSHPNNNSKQRQILGNLGNYCNNYCWIYWCNFCNFIMKKVLFIMTHIGSGWEELAETLNEHPNIVCYTTGYSYHHPKDLDFLTNRLHKKDNSAAVWADVILHNKDFTCKALCKHCRFIYWCSSSVGSVSLEAYRYRTQGLGEYYRRTGGLWNPSLDGDGIFASILGGEDHAVASEFLPHPLI